MNKQELIELKKKIARLSEEEKKQRDLELRKMALGEIQGPATGYPSIDKPWLKFYSEKAITEDLPQKNVYEFLYEQNKNYPNRIALSYYGRKITFEELFERIDEVARSLIANGVKENDAVSISLPNIPEAVYLFYAVSKIGAIANMIDPRTSQEGIRCYVEEANSDLLIMVDTHYNKVKKFTENGICKKIISVSPAESLPFALNYGYRAKQFVESLKKPSTKIALNANSQNWKDFIKTGNQIQKLPELEYKEDRPLVIEHTGGTTGNPKGVLLSNKSVNAVAIQCISTGIDMQREHNWLDIMPTFIAYGITMGLHLPLTIGMETILIPQFDAQKFDELIYKHKPIHMVGVPSYWDTIIRSKKLAKKDLSYIIAPTVGGDMMNHDLEIESNKFLKEHNCTSKITKGYGMTEVCGGISGTVDANNEIGSVGIPFVKSVIAIFDPETGEELGYNQNGEVCMTGPNTMLGYLNNKEATSELLRIHEDGTVWVHSGDIGYINEKGNLFIIDRLKRMIIRYDGFKIFPSIIENIISSHPSVESCKVVSIADENHIQGRLPKAHIVLKKENELLDETIIEEIKKICRQQLPEYAQPHSYKIRDFLPLTAIGKVDYLSLEAEDIHIKNRSVGPNLTKKK